MLFRENWGMSYCCKGESMLIERQVFKVESFGMGFLLSKKKKRPGLVVDGITHYNTFNTKPFNPQQFTRTKKKKTASLTPVRLKKSLKQPLNFLPKLNPLKINLQSKSNFYRKLLKNLPTSKDENLSTDDLTLL